MTAYPGAYDSAPDDSPAPEPAAVRFVAAVASQLARAGSEASRAERDTLARRISSLLRSIERDETASVSATLAADHVLLAAFFQNADLLYADSYAYADAVSMVVLGALHDALEAQE